MNTRAHLLGALALLVSIGLNARAADIELSTDGCTLYVSQSSAIGRLNLCTNQTLSELSLAAIPDRSGVYALKTLVDGSLLIALGNSIARLDSEGALVGSYDLPGADCWAGITVAAGGESFWASSCEGRLAQFDLGSGTAIQVVNGVDGGHPPLAIEHDRWMFGGGTTYTTTGVQVNHGAELHCDSSVEPNNLQIIWNGGNVFFLQHVTSVSCTGSPFSTLQGAGTGTINGQGPATAEWTLVDGGQPGVVRDSVRLVVRDAKGEVAVEVSGRLEAGNQTAK